MERRENKGWTDGGVLAMLAESSFSEEEEEETGTVRPPNVLLISKYHDETDDEQHELSISSINSRSLFHLKSEKRSSRIEKRNRTLESDKDVSSLDESFVSNESCHSPSSAGSESVISETLHESGSLSNESNGKRWKNSKELKGFISSPMSDEDDEPEEDNHVLDESDYEPEDNDESSDSDETCSEESMDSDADEIRPIRHVQSDFDKTGNMSMSTSNIADLSTGKLSPRENLQDKFSNSKKDVSTEENLQDSVENSVKKNNSRKSRSPRKKMKDCFGDNDEDFTENDSLIEVDTANESDDNCDVYTGNESDDNCEVYTGNESDDDNCEEIVAEIVDDDDINNLIEDTEAMDVSSFFSSDKENQGFDVEEHPEVPKSISTTYNLEAKKIETNVSQIDDANKELDRQVLCNVDKATDISHTKNGSRGKNQRMETCLLDRPSSLNQTTMSSRQSKKESESIRKITSVDDVVFLSDHGTSTTNSEPSKSKHRRDGSVRQGMWILGAKIGSGAFGTVHVGMNTATGTLMAVKSVKMDPSVMGDVRREVELLKSLNHVNIVRYYGAEIDAQYLHIFQEWVPAGSVTLMLQKFGPFPIAVLRQYLLQTLKGLAYLHENNIMHRDIKGSNILVSDGGIVKLADFGASKRFTNIEKNMTLSLTMRGTPYFMAPEVFEEKYCMKADIWSVGCVAFQMVAGTPPWKNLGFSNPISLFQHLQKVKDPPPMTIPNEDAILLTKDGRQKLDLLKGCVGRCFARNPIDRPSADEMVCDNFFSNEHLWNDTDQSDYLGLFSPSPPLSKKPKGPYIAKDVSPMQARIGLIASPLLSPSIPQIQPLPHSPPPDASGWPTWARNRHSQNNFGSQPTAVNNVDISEMMNSLAFSDDSNPNDHAKSEASIIFDHNKLPSRIDEESHENSQPTLSSSLIGTKFAEEEGCGEILRR